MNIMSMQLNFLNDPKLLIGIGVIPLNFDEVLDIAKKLADSANSAINSNTLVKIESGLASVDLGKVVRYCNDFHAGFFCRSLGDSNITIIFSAKHSPMFGLVASKIPWQVKTWGVEFWLCPDNPSSLNYFIGFEYVNYCDGVIKRHVRVMREDDGKLRFFQNGEIQEFENSNQYGKRKITDRLNREIIFKYIKEFGVDVDIELAGATSKDSATFSVLHVADFR